MWGKAMVRFRVLLALVLALSIGAGVARAGPWPREQGRFFLSTTSTLGAANGWRPQQTEYYAEYGLRPRLTIGAALSTSWRVDYADLFLRWHPLDLPQGLVFGVTSGVRYVPYSIAPYQPFVAVEAGRGMALGGGNLWTQAGVRLYAARVPWGTELATDWSSQIGYARGRWLVMMGATHFRSRRVAITRLRPAIGLRLMDRFRLVAEAVIPPGGRVDAVRIGLWSEF